MPLIEVSKWIPAPSKEVYEVVRNMEAYPLFMKNLDSVTVLERLKDATITKWIANMDGIPLEWTERDVFDEENGRILYQQIEGDLSKFEGEWNVKPDGAGSIVSLSVDVELDIPMFSAMIEPLLKKKVQENSLNMLQSIEKTFFSLNSVQGNSSGASAEIL